MRRIYTKSWFDIRYESFVTMDSKGIADVDFYDKFYDEFYKKFSSYEELPLKWRDDKEAVADFIVKQTSISDRLLSIGCGNAVG